MTDNRMPALCWMAITAEMHARATEDYSEGEEIEDVRARLEVARYALDRTLQLID